MKEQSEADKVLAAKLDQWLELQVQIARDVMLPDVSDDARARVRRTLATSSRVMLEAIAKTIETPEQAAWFASFAANILRASGVEVDLRDQRKAPN